MPVAVAMPYFEFHDAAAIRHAVYPDAGCRAAVAYARAAYAQYARSTQARARNTATRLMLQIEMVSPRQPIASI